MPLMLVALEEYLDARPEAAAVADAERRSGRSAAARRTSCRSRSRRSTVRSPGDRVERSTTLSLTIKDGWHVYANPTGVDGIPPTRVALDGPARASS